MIGYVVKRLLYAIVVMWAAATLVFFGMRSVPGDPFRAMLAFEATPERAEELRAEWGLNDPLHVQYVKWFGNLVQGNLGFSIWNKQPVTQLIVQALPRTISLGTLAFLISMLIAVPAGIISAIRQHSLLDHVSTTIAFFGLSMPNFWFGIVLILIFGVHLQWLPTFGYAPLHEGLWPWLSHLIMPAIAVGTAFAAIVTRMTRSAMLEILRSDYIRTARSKGLGETRVLVKHGLRNALIPVVTVTGISFALLLGGSVVVETVFAIKGIGRLLISGIVNRDYPIVQGAILLIAWTFVLVNLMVDLVYTYIDPRIRYVD